jgi:tetraacyldisaccharide 4'-kinase
MLIRRIFAKRERFNVPIISVGNLIVGGSGKTPFIIEIASRYKDVTIISRGYGRKSKGLVEVSKNGKILTTVENSGDEALLMAQSLNHCSVIVSEDRKIAIRKAIENGAKIILLDDGFNRVDIEKFEIILEPKKIKNYFTLPAGAFREFFFISIITKFVDIKAVESKDYKRVVEYKNLTDKMLLVTAIANPKRLDNYLPKGVVKKYYLSDHSFFDEDKIRQEMNSYGAGSILVTQKDLVKMDNFDLNISVIKLKLNIDTDILNKIDIYIKTAKK